MAKIQEELYVIKLSKLIRNNEDDVAAIADNDFEGNLQAILQEMIGGSVIVEVEKA
mgnify:FL=1